MKNRMLVRTTLVLFGVFGMMMPAFESQAEILEDSTVGITYALDEYLASIQMKELKEAEVASDKASNCKYPEFEGKCLAYVEEAVNVRKEPDEEAERVGSLPVHGIALVVEKGDTWTLIESGITLGYVIW